MKKLLVLTTGGTIASTKTAQGLAPGMTANELMTYVVPRDNVTISVENIMGKDSTNMQPEDWLIIARRILEQQDEFDGFVVTHGTDTMGYTAAALSYLLYGIKRPVVLTGSQIPISEIQSDAIRNLDDAVTFASQTHLTGVYLVFNGLVMMGTRAVKTKTKSYDAFD